MLLKNHKQRQPLFFVGLLVILLSIGLFYLVSMLDPGIRNSPFIKAATSLPERLILGGILIPMACVLIFQKYFLEAAVTLTGKPLVAVFLIALLSGLLQFRSLSAASLLFLLNVVFSLFYLLAQERKINAYWPVAIAAVISSTTVILCWS